jgi:hypothetical protein
MGVRPGAGRRAVNVSTGSPGGADSEKVVSSSCSAGTGVLCGPWESWSMQSASWQPKAALAVMAPKTGRVTCTLCNISSLETWPFFTIVFPDDSQSYDSVFHYHALACDISLAFPWQIHYYAQPFKFQMIQMHWIYRHEVCHTLRFFLVNLFKTTIITHCSYSPNDCTVAWRYRELIRTNNAHMLLYIVNVNIVSKIRRSNLFLSFFEG